MITITSLTHPTMIAKIRAGLRCAALKRGHEMGGHANRVYIANRKGHNILRINWLGNGNFVAYGGADWGQTDVTKIVKQALKRANCRTIHTYSEAPVSTLGKLASLACVGIALTGCQASGSMTVLFNVLTGWLT